MWPIVYIFGVLSPIDDNKCFVVSSTPCGDQFSIRFEFSARFEVKILCIKYVDVALHHTFLVIVHISRKIDPPAHQPPALCGGRNLWMASY